MGEYSDPPWQCDGSRLVDKDGNDIGEVYYQEDWSLVAAAPLLLSALKVFVQMDDNGEEITGAAWNAAIVMARAALAKAAGRETSRE